MSDTRLMSTPLSSTVALQHDDSYGQPTILESNPPRCRLLHQQAISNHASADLRALICPQTHANVILLALLTVVFIFLHPRRSHSMPIPTLIRSAIRMTMCPLPAIFCTLTILPSLGVQGSNIPLLARQRSPSTRRWLTPPLKFYGIYPRSRDPSIAYHICDNLNAMSLNAYPVFHSRMKHIVLAYHFCSGTHSAWNISCICRRRICKARDLRNGIPMPIEKTFQEDTHPRTAPTQACLTS
ncbi:hypothetical protein V2J09_006419 [Rumex salicifolius]